MEIDSAAKSVLVVRHVEPNGTECWAGHDILDALETDENFNHFVAEAIRQCDEAER